MEVRSSARCTASQVSNAGVSSTQAEGADAGESGSITTGGAKSPRSLQASDVRSQTSTVRSQASIEREYHAIACAIDKDVLRAVRAWKCLWNFGEILRSNAGSMDTYKLSEQVEKISSFWSHSWRAVSRYKILTLLYVYNGPKALYTSILASLVATALVHLHVLPGATCFSTGCSVHNDCSSKAYCAGNTSVGNYCQHISLCCVYFNSVDEQCPNVTCPVPDQLPFRYWPSIIGFVTYLIALCFWPTQALVFLDKVCIHQTDADKKQRGIDGLGGFLHHSEEMLLLWDKTYFTRLWCTFEVASFSHLHGEDTSIRVVPILRGYILVVTVIIVFLLEFVTNLFIDYGYPALGNFLYPIFNLLFGFWLSGLARAFARDYANLRQQLENFECEKAQCFCCSVDHVLPGTDMPLDCDRQVVYGAIRSWYRHGLPEFERVVRCTLLDKIFSQRANLFAYHQIFYMAVPVFWTNCSSFGTYCLHWTHVEHAIIVAAIFMFGLYPLLAALIIWLSIHTKQTRARCDWCVNVGVSFVWAVTSYAFNVALQYATMMDLYVGLAVGLVYAGIAWCFLSASTRCAQMRACYKRTLHWNTYPAKVDKKVNKKGDATSSQSDMPVEKMSEEQNDTCLAAHLPTELHASSLLAPSVASDQREVFRGSESLRHHAEPCRTPFSETPHGSSSRRVILI